MKTTNFKFKTAVLLFLSVLSIFLTACSDNNITGGSFTDISDPSLMPGDTGISIQVGKQVGYNFWLVTVINNSRDTLNDFHVQMTDSSARFISPNTMNSGWQNVYGGQNHNDSSKIDLKTSRGLAYQPIKPGQQKQLLGFYAGFGKSPTKKISFNWQATKDGEIIRSGSYSD